MFRRLLVLQRLRVMFHMRRVGEIVVGGNAINTEERLQTSRMFWNQAPREQRVAEETHRYQQQLPRIMVPGQPGYVRVGNVSMEKSNPEKLEALTCLAAKRGWEITIVSECDPSPMSPLEVGRLGTDSRRFGRYPP